MTTCRPRVHFSLNKMTSRRRISRLGPALLAIELMASACGGSDVVVPESSTTTGTSTGGEPGASAVGTSGAVVPTTGVASEGTGSAEATSGDSTTGGVLDTGSESTGNTDGSTDGSTGATSTSETGETTTGDAPAIPGPKVKIMTFNIRVGTAQDGENAWDKRKQLVYQILKDKDADFIGMQEALHFQLQEIDDHMAGYARIGVGTVDGKTKGPLNAIYYRKSRFSVKQSDTFWLSKTPEVPGSQTWGNEFPRAVTWGRFLEKDTGYTLYVYNTHFDHVSQNSREKGAVLLAGRIADRQAQKDPYAVTGDFNAAEGNLAIRFLKGDAAIDGQMTAVPLRDTFRVVKPDAKNVGTAHGFNGGTGGNKIDYIFVPPKQKVNDAWIDHYNVDGRYPSDHFPVLAVVTFEDGD